MHNVYKSLLVILSLCMLTAAKAPTALTENDRQLLKAVKKGQDKEVKELFGKGVILISKMRSKTLRSLLL